MFYRVKIVEITQRDMETNRIVEVQVYFIDRGFYENVPSANLFEIAPQFVDLPYQVSSLFISSLWSHEFGKLSAFSIFKGEEM